MRGFLAGSLICSNDYDRGCLQCGRKIIGVQGVALFEDL